MQLSKFNNIKKLIKELEQSQLDYKKKRAKEVKDKVNNALLSELSFGIYDHEELSTQRNFNEALMSISIDNKVQEFIFSQIKSLISGYVLAVMNSHEEIKNFINIKSKIHNNKDKIVIDNINSLNNGFKHNDNPKVIKTLEKMNNNPFEYFINNSQMLEKFININKSIDIDNIPRII